MMDEREEIAFHTPGALAAVLPYALQAAGHGLALPGAEPTRKRYRDHVLLIATQGQGWIETGGATHAVLPGMVAWLDTSRPYAHGAAGEGHWRYYWMGLRGAGLDALHRVLDVPRQPLFLPEACRDMEAAFAAVLRLAQQGGPAVDALVNAQVALIVSRLAAGRPADEGRTQDPRITALMERLRASLSHPWRIGDMAALTGLSPSQLFRAFRAAAGTTPMDFLRHERITAAKRALMESSGTVAEVAAACGYADPYHFSRDFRRLTGLPPARFRKGAGF